jgi:hypothetical protein
MITPATIAFTIILSLIVFVIPRRYILVPYLVAAVFVPADQCLIIANLHFYVLQILVIAGVTRLYLRGESESVVWNRFDKLVVAWAVVGAVVYVILWSDMRAVVWKCGRLLDMLGLYWVFRHSIRSWADIRLVFTALAICSLVLVPFVAYEWTTGNNPFMVFGRGATELREGLYRCRASFPHSIMFGLFFVAIFPLFVGFAIIGPHKFLLWAASAAVVFIVFATHTSTTFLSLLIVAALLPCYKWRQNTRLAAWGLLVGLVGLHLVMKAPVWALIGRVGVIPGSTGWHRFLLLDAAIKHFPEWMLIGCRDTEHWGRGLSDVTNQYVLEGVRGGLITLVVFLAMIYAALKVLVQLSLQYREKNLRFLAWCLFVSIIGHCVAFFGVSYWGQVTIVWDMTLAIVGFLYGQTQAKETPAVQHERFVALE